jgi:hypothetical protein
MASTLFEHERDDTSHILTTEDGSSFVLSGTRSLLESAWTQALTGQYMFKPNLLSWVSLHPVTQQIVLQPGSFAEWVDRHTESVAILQHIRETRSEGVRIPQFDQDRGFSAQKIHDEGMKGVLDSWGSSLVAWSRLGNRYVIPHSQYAQACPAGVCLHLKNWYNTYRTGFYHADYLHKRLQTIVPSQYGDE